MGEVRTVLVVYCIISRVHIPHMGLCMAFVGWVYLLIWATVDMSRNKKVTGQETRASYSTLAFRKKCMHSPIFSVPVHLRKSKLCISQTTINIYGSEVSASKTPYCDPPIFPSPLWTPALASLLRTNLFSATLPGSFSVPISPFQLAFLLSSESKPPSVKFFPFGFPEPERY